MWSLFSKSRTNTALYQSHEIGFGGIAQIFLRLYPNGHREVEKVLLPKYSGHSTFEALLEREWRVMCSLPRHPLVIQAYRFEQSEQVPKLILEPVSGNSLSSFIPYFHTLSSDDQEKWALQLLKQFYSAVTWLHEHRVVHGDLSPENVLIDEGGLIRIIDFGTASIEGQDGFPLPVEGKNFFRAPELKVSGGTSREGDLFAVGRMIEFLFQNEESVPPTIQEQIDCLVEKRMWPKFDSSKISALSLPEIRPQSGVNAASKLTTKICVAPAFWHRIPRRVINVSGYVCALLLTSWLPSSTIITVNSWPHSRLAISCPQFNRVMETPIHSLQVPSGACVLEFQIPSQSNRKVMKRVRLLPGDSVKIFEEF